MAEAAARFVNPRRPVRHEMGTILTEQPMMGSTALFMGTIAHPDGDPGQIAATDGQVLHFWPPYFEYGFGDRLGILLHEILHAVLAHPARGMRLRSRLGPEYRHDVMNVAADAIVNAAIEKLRSGRITLPDDGISLSELQRQAEAIVSLTGVGVDHARFGTLSKLSLEWLYDALVRLHDAAIRHQTETADPENGRPANGTSPESGEATPEERERARVRMARERLRDSFIDQMKGEGDILINALGKMAPDEIEATIRLAGLKVKSAMAMHGTGSRGILEHLGGDIPEVRTRWESSFRSITQRHLSPRRERQPTRPGRRMLAQEAIGAKNITWNPARRRPPVPRVVVVLDSSGSTSPNEYLRYLGEIQAMKRRTNAHVIAIVADAQVHSVREIEHVSDIAEVEFEGRGGTDFRPAFVIAEDMQPDLLVYLTDLMGTFPEAAPSFPVLWTINSPEVPNGYQPPFGRVLTLR